MGSGFLAGGGGGGGGGGWREIGKGEGRQYRGWGRMPLTTKTIYQSIL